MKINEFYQEIMKKMEADYSYNVTEKTPLLICTRCNGKYVLPMEYELCSKELRDYCPNCVIDVMEKLIKDQEMQREDEEREMQDVKDH